VPHQAKVSLDTNRVIGQISPLLFSGFAEHMGRCIYEGIYDPGSPKADARGFRTDVLKALKALNFRSIRYPGGNFVSGYKWLDALDPKKTVQAGASWHGVQSKPISLVRTILWHSAATLALHL
jgi:alpha-L-arabinofuranosidase